jgi:hypothetical protein
MTQINPDVSKSIDLDALKLETLNRIPKEVFIRNYAPLIFDTDPSVFNLRWVAEVASSPTHEVIMVDNLGNILSIIPPLRVTTLKNINLGPELSSELEVYGIQKSIKKNQSENRLINTLNKLDLHISVTPELELRWRKLLIECGFGEMIEQHSIAKTVVSEINLDVWETF